MIHPGVRTDALVIIILVHMSLTQFPSFSPRGPPTHRTTMSRRTTPPSPSPFALKPSDGHLSPMPHATRGAALTIPHSRHAQDGGALAKFVSFPRQLSSHVGYSSFSALDTTYNTPFAVYDRTTSSQMVSAKLRTASSQPGLADGRKDIETNFGFHECAEAISWWNSFIPALDDSTQQGQDDERCVWDCRSVGTY